MDLKKCFDKLNSYTNQNLTTKELNELGITNYFINKLIEKGKLVRIKRGIYCVKSLYKKNKQTFFAIHNFCESISSNNYKKAFYDLMQIYERKMDNRSDNLIRIGFILLQEILKKEDIISSLNNLENLILEDKPNSEYWNKFCESVVNKDFLAAKENIELSAQNQLKNQGFIGEVTQAMVQLVNKVIAIREENSHKTNIWEYNYHFKRFLEVFRIDNLEEAMQELSLSLSYSDTGNKKYKANQDLLNMFKKLIRMRDNGEGFDEINVKYNIKDIPINNFNLAIQKGDYKKALAFSHLVKLEDSVTFKIKSELLTEMSKLDKTREKNNELIKASQEKSIKDFLSSKEIVEKNQIIESENSPKKEYDAIINDALKEKVANLELNYANIYDLVYNREYDLAYALMMRDKEHGELNRLCNICIRLIKILKNLEKGFAKTTRKGEITGDRLKDFYQTLNNDDYEAAYELADEIIYRLSNTSNSPREFEIYKLLLEDVKELHKKVVTTKEKIEYLDDKLTDMSIKPAITRREIEELIEILSEKIALSLELSLPIDFDSSLLNIAETTILSLDGKLNDTDFDKVKSENSIDSLLFIDSLNQGDYLTSQKIINSIDWVEFKRKFSFVFLRLAKKMLNMMIANLRIVSDKTLSKDKLAKEKITEETQAKIDEFVYKLLTDEDKKINNKLVFLQTIRPMIKVRHYEEVFQKVLESDVSFNDEFASDILGNLVFIKSDLDHQANELYDKYLKSLETCNNEETQRYLEDYREFLLENYMEDTKLPNQKSLKPQE